MPIALLAHADRADAETEKAGIESAESGFDRGEVQEIVVHDLAQLGILLAGRTASDRKHAVDSGIEQAFAQDALPDHSGGAEQDDFHALIRRKSAAAGIVSPRR